MLVHTIGTMNYIYISYVFCNLKNCLATEKYNYINNGGKNVVLKIPQYYFVFSEKDKNMDKGFFIMSFQSTVKY